MVPDATLVTRARDGDDSAFAVLLDRHVGEVHDLLVRLVGRDAATDLATTTFARARDGLDRLGDPEAFRPWVLALAMVRARDAWATGVVPDPEDAGLAEVDAERLPDRRRLAAAAASAPAVWAALARLAGETRAVLLLHLRHGLDAATTARVVGRPPSDGEALLAASLERLAATAPVGPPPARDVVGAWSVLPADATSVWRSLTAGSLPTETGLRPSDRVGAGLLAALVVVTALVGTSLWRALQPSTDAVLTALTATPLDASETIPVTNTATPQLIMPPSPQPDTEPTLEVVIPETTEPEPSPSPSPEPEPSPTPSPTESPTPSPTETETGGGIIPTPTLLPGDGSEPTETETSPSQAPPGGEAGGG